MDSVWDTLWGQAMPPHGHCYLWNDSLVYTHVISDSLIALAYFTIPIALVVLVKKRDDLSFNYMFVLFAVFIFACGATHLMAIYNVWHGAYWLSGLLKGITALASVLTAILVWPLIPRVLALPSNQELLDINHRLREESERVREQKREVTRLSKELRTLVQKRTLELEETRKIKTLLETKNTELELSNEALEQFAHIASHDLKEPVRTIGNLGTMLTTKLKSRLDEEAAQWLHHIISASERLGNLVNSLQAFTFLTPSNEPFANVELDPLVDNVIEDLGAAIEDNEVVIHREALPVIHGNSQTIQQLLFNLISNAIKFSRHSKPPTVEIGPLPENDAGETGFYVKDNGIGIPLEYKDKIFGIFERVHHDERFEGSGVGLAICKRVLEQHGGRAEVHSVLGEGTEFRIYFTPVITA